MKQQIILTPYNKPSKALANKLSNDKNANIVFIDSYKHNNETVFHPNDLKNIKIDKIIITSPQFYKQIYKTLITNKIPTNKIFFYNAINTKFYNSKLLYKFSLFLQSIINKYTYKNSQYKLKHYKNKHTNQKCFIIGNGPSLTIEDLEKLKNEITFASNKIYLAFNETLWRPTYYFVEDHLVLAQNYKEIISLDGFQKFFPQITLHWMPKVHNGIYYPLIYDFKQPNFSDNPNKGLYWGASVTYSMIQMAIYMGFKEIYLLGVDFDFIKSNKKLYIGESGIYLSNGEQNHFHKNYREAGEQWTVPDMKFQKKSFKKAKKFCEENNIEIYNASKNTKLNVFKKINFNNLLHYKD